MAMSFALRKFGHRPIFPIADLHTMVLEVQLDVFTPGPWGVQAKPRKSRGSVWFWCFDKMLVGKTKEVTRT